MQSNPPLKRALGASVLVRFLRRIFGHCCGLVYGEGGTPGTVHLHNLRVTSHLLHQEVPLGWYRVRPGEGRGGGPGTVPLQNPEVTSRKACLRNAEGWESRGDADTCVLRGQAHS